MADAVPSEAGQRCPHCGAQCPPNVLVCPACGVHVAAYESVHGKMQEAQQAQLRTHVAELEQLSAEQANNQRELDKQRRKRQVIALFVGALLLALLIFGAAEIYAHQRKLAAERLAGDYQRATACLETGDYLCAREGFEAVMRQDRSYAQAHAGLSTAHLKLAQQYTRAGQWQAGLDEVDALLRDDPANEPALALAEEILTRWYSDALAKNQWLTAWRVRAIKRARFPEKTTPTVENKQIP